MYGILFVIFLNEKIKYLELIIYKCLYEILGKQFSEKRPHTEIPSLGRTALLN
jgi:hypothetical protein